MTKTGFTDPEDEWNKLVEANEELRDYARGKMPRATHISTNMRPHAVVTADGNLGIWLKLNPFQAAAWYSAMMHVACPNPDTEGNLDDASWEDTADMDIYHDMALHFLGDKLAEWIVPMRRAFFELGWEELLESDPIGNQGDNDDE